MTSLYPKFRNYSKLQLNNKYFGGSVIFINEEKERARYVDTTNMDMSMWISDMKRGTGPITFRLRTHYDVMWEATIDGRNVNGVTLPKTVFDLGEKRDIYNIYIEATGPHNDNYEFFLWSVELNPRIIIYS